MPLVPSACSTNPFVVMLLLAAGLAFLAYGLTSSDVSNLILGCALLFLCFCESPRSIMP